MIYTSDYGQDCPFQMLQDSYGSIYIDTCSLLLVVILSNEGPLKTSEKHVHEAKNVEQPH